MDLSTTGKLLVVLGAGVVGLGLLLVVGSALGLGRLPGDFSFGKGTNRVFVPLATSLLLSVVATVVINLLLRR